MSKFANEKEFDERLARIGMLYEEGKDLVSKTISVVEHQEEFWRLRAVLEELRTIAALSVKANHELKDN